MRFILLFILISVPLFSLSQGKLPIFYSEKDSLANIWVDSIISTMNNDDKIGQLFMVAAYSNNKK